MGLELIRILMPTKLLNIRGEAFLKAVLNLGMHLIIKAKLIGLFDFLKEDIDTPWAKLSKKCQDIILFGINKKIQFR